MPKTITMSQIAKELDLNRTTVSYIINGHGEKRGYASETIERVNNYLKEKGYVPSRQAVALKNGHHTSIGVLHCGHLYSHLTDAFNRMSDHINQDPEAVEYQIVPRPQLTKGIRELRARRVSKLVWVHTQNAQREFNDPEIFNYITNFDTVVIYNYHFSPEDNSKELLKRGYNLVGIDRVGGYRQLAAFLYKLGHRCVVLPDIGSQELRSEIMQEAGIKTVISETKDAFDLSNSKRAQSIVKGVLGAIKKEKATAACLHSDELAGYLMKELQQQGVRIPDDLTVTGYDGLPIAEVFSPPLTTLSVPVEKMVGQVKNLLAGKSKGERHCYKMGLVKRFSHTRSGIQK